MERQELMYDALSMYTHILSKLKYSTGMVCSGVENGNEIVSIEVLSLHSRNCSNNY